MTKRTIKLNIKLPKGILATPELDAIALAAAHATVQSAVKDLQTLQKNCRGSF